MREKDEANIIAVFSLTPKPKFMRKKHESDGFNNDLSENPISNNLLASKYKIDAAKQA